MKKALTLIELMLALVISSITDSLVYDGCNRKNHPSNVEVVR